MRYRVIITDQALRRIEEQARYIAEEGHAPLNAARWLSRVLAAADELETMPRRFARALEDGHRGLEIRDVNIDGYLLLFTIDDATGTVFVLNARHGRQMPRPEEIDPPRGL